MASFEKMAKSLMENTTNTAVMVTQIAQDTALLETMLKNQEVIIVQNQKLIEILDRLQSVLVEKA